MYDINSGEKTANVANAVFAFIVIGFASIFFMMWWGYGGYDAVAPKALSSLLAQILIYLCVELIVVHGLFFFASRPTRKGALYGFLAPWVVVNLITLPQIGHDPKGVLLMLVVPALCTGAYVMVERLRKSTDS